MGEGSGEILRYWSWLRRIGYKSFLNLNTFINIIIAALIAGLVPIEIKDAASVILFPTLSILIGMTYAWAANSSSLLQDDDVILFAEAQKGGFQSYIFEYQSSVLVVLLALVIWSAVALKIIPIDLVKKSEIGYFSLKTFLFFFLALAINECWQTIMATNWLLLSKYTIVKHRKEMSLKAPRDAEVKVDG